MFNESFEEQSSHNHRWYDYGMFVLEGPHQTLTLFIGFMEFSYLHTNIRLINVLSTSKGVELLEFI